MQILSSPNRLETHTTPALSRSLASIVLAATVVIGSPVSAVSAGPDPTGAVSPATIQPVEEGVWKVISDGAGNWLGAGDTVTIDRQGRILVCCSEARVDGEQVQQAVRFGDPAPALTFEPSGAVLYPSELALDAAGTYWVTGQGAIATYDEVGWTTHQPSRDRGTMVGDVIGFGVDGSAWTSVAGDRPAVARLADGTWTGFDDAAGLPRLTARWSGQVSAIEGTPDGSIWVGITADDRSKPGGLLRFDGADWHKVWPLGKGTRARVEGLTVDLDGRLWAYLSQPTSGKRFRSSLASWDGSEWTVYGKAEGVPAAGPYDDYTRMRLEAAPNGTIWLTTRGGFGCARLVAFDGNASISYMEKACVKDLAVATDGSVWVSAEWLTNYGAARYDDGLYVITPGADAPYPSGSTVVSAPEPADGPVAQASTEYLQQCQIAAGSDAERRMCALIAPFVTDAIRTAVDSCGGEDAEGDGAGMCLAFLAPMIVDAMMPPPWRDTTDVDIAGAYLDLIALHGAPADESGSHAGLDPAQAEAAWEAASASSIRLAQSIAELGVPAHAEVIAADTAERLTALAAAQRALAATPDDAGAIDAYRAAVGAAEASETELRWALGLPPPAAAVWRRFDDAFDDDGIDLQRGRAVQAMVNGRTDHAATKLPGGRVLLLGGDAGGEPTRTAEFFDPATGSFMKAPRLPTPRTRHHAVVIPDGRVLVLGGYDRQYAPITDVLVVDPVTGASESISSLSEFFRVDVVAPLQDGRVLVVGPGYQSAAVGAIVDPVTGTVELFESPIEGRDGGTATQMDDGTVLLFGGTGEWGGDKSDSAEVFDPKSGDSTMTRPPIHARSGHTATLLADGTVLIAGGSAGLATLASATIFEPRSRSFAAVGSLARPRTGHTATLLNDGRVLIVGGHSGTDAFDTISTAEIYDPTEQRFQTTGAMEHGRSGHSATLLDDGRVLVAGGEGDSGPMASAELYDPAAGTFSTVTATS